MDERLPSISDAVEAYLRDKAISCAPATVRTNRFLLSPLASDDRLLSVFDGQLCRTLILGRQGADLTRLALYKALRGFGGWCVSQRLLGANPMDGCPRPLVREKPHRYLPPDEIRQLFAVLGQGKRDQTTRLMLLLLLEGLRASELVGLVWSDVREDRIIVRGKGGRYRAIPLRDQVREMLEKCESPPHARGRASHAGPHGPSLVPSVSPSRRIFKGDTGSLRDRLRRLGTRAGIPGCHPHLFRHSFASLSNS